MKRCRLVGELGVLIVVVGSGAADSYAGATLTREALQNAVYRSEYVESGEVKLVKGKASVDDPDGKVTVSLTDFVAFGDLNGDGSEDAAAVLVTSAGGTGSFYELAAVISRQEKPAHLGSVQLGDRIIIESVSIAGGRVIVRMIVHKRDDPQCCPTSHVNKTYELKGSQLLEIAPAQNK